MNLKQFLPPGLKLFLKRFLRPTPMQCVLAGLSRRGVRLGRLDALELFAFQGEWHTRDYAGRVRSLEAWEVDPACLPRLRATLPRATIKVTDSFEEIRRTPKKYGLIVVDNPMSVYGDRDQYCEHFELFPAVFRALQDEAVMILSVIPQARPAYRAEYPYLFNASQLASRRRFYQSPDPEHMTVEQMAAAYARHAAAAGFTVAWHFAQRRGASEIHYLALKLVRSAAGAAGSPARPAA